jgi:hypothetical protein
LPRKRIPRQSFSIGERKPLITVTPSSRISAQCRWCARWHPRERGQSRTVRYCIAPRDSLDRSRATYAARLSRDAPILSSANRRRRASVSLGPNRSFLLALGFTPHPVFDVVVDDEVQLLLRESLVRRQHLVDFVEDGLGAPQCFVTTTRNDAALLLSILRPIEL